MVPAISEGGTTNSHQAIRPENPKKGKGKRTTAHSTKSYPI